MTAVVRAAAGPAGLPATKDHALLTLVLAAGSNLTQDSARFSSALFLMYLRLTLFS